MTSTKILVLVGHADPCGNKGTEGHDATVLHRLMLHKELLEGNMEPLRTNHRRAFLS